MTTYTASAPARVNIIGEHTDYNAGFVLPTCTALRTKVTATERSDRTINVRSALADEQLTFGLDELQPDPTGSWIEYVKGVAAGLLAAGIELRGADMAIESNIPPGAGLSSSASLELSVARALLAVANESMSAPDLAMLCQNAEHEYAGVQCGIMDQYALACARYGNALLLDCRTLEASQTSLPGDMSLILTDSGVRHSLVDGGYNDRAEECAKAAAIIQRRYPAVTALRDVDRGMLDASRHELGDRLYQRAAHVVSENERVQHMVQALADGDLEQVGLLLTECHVSLRDDFQVSCNEVDVLVEAAINSERVLGARMVGAGFGGCVLSVCRKEDERFAAEHIRASHAKKSGREPWQHIVAPAHPARSAELS